MQNNSLKSKTISNMMWCYAERCGAQGIQFVVSIVLARLLSPSDYGTIGLITVFIAIATVFISSGFSQALVQKKEADNKDFSSVFYFTMLSSVLLYIIMFFSAPFIARFYKNTLLVPVVRVLSITLLLGGVNSVQRAYVQKTMQFKRFFFATIIGTMISAFTGIIVAINGGGVWALVTQQLTNQLFDTIILWCTVKWRPQKGFSFNRMKRLFSYGWKILCSALLDTGYNNIYSLIIGRFFSPADLGFYSKGQMLPSMVVTNANSAIDSVMLPVMSAVQDKKEQLKSMMRRSIVTSTFIIFPAMAGLAAVAKPLTIVLLTKKWLPAVPFIQFCCFSYAFWPLSTANLQAIKAVGRSDIFLKLEIIKKVLGITALCVTLPYGLYAMMWGKSVNTVVCVALNAYPNKKLLNYSYFEQIKDVFPALALSVLMCAVVLCINIVPINVFTVLVLQLVCGMTIYFGAAKLFKLETYEYLWRMLKEFKEGREKK